MTHSISSQARYCLPSGTGIKFVVLREWSGKVMITKSICIWAQSDTHKNKLHIRWELFKTCHNWHILSYNLTYLSILWASHHSTPVVIVRHQKVNLWGHDKKTSLKRKYVKIITPTCKRCQSFLWRVTFYQHLNNVLPHVAKKQFMLLLLHMKTLQFQSLVILKPWIIVPWSFPF
jgi:hypothetical protein